jgi:hypothetical protein
MHSGEHHFLVHPASFRPENWLRFVQIDPFPRHWSRLQLTDDDLRALEIGIMLGPESHPVVRGTDGMRKLRFTKPGSGKGKSNSYRAYYVYLPGFGTVWLMAVIAKNEADLTAADRNAFAQVIGRLRMLLDRGVIR